MSDPEITYVRTGDGLVHALFPMDGTLYSVCGVSLEDVTERMFTAEATCLGCLARKEEAFAAIVLEHQLRATLQNQRLGEYTKDDAKNTLKLFQALDPKRGIKR